MQKLRAHAIAHSLFAPTTLQAAIEQLGFVQADPIRSPAPAQDLILRHRVQGYRVGDLARAYPELDVEEGILYAYGFVPRRVWRLRQHDSDPSALPELEQRILAGLRAEGPRHPSELVAEFGTERVRNAWGGTSRAVTRALESLAWHGLVRVSGRRNGTKIYAAAQPPAADRDSAADRFRQLVLTEAHIMAPVRESTLAFLTSGLRRISFDTIRSHRAVIQDLIRAGELERREVDGVSYLWPAGTFTETEAPRTVRLLAPFDPVVWDRGRFQHLWQWEYRFEAYTKKEQRVRGYYAMPLLWGDAVIGWANVSAGKLDVELGYIGKKPAGREFRRELDAEIGRLGEFLGVV